MKELPFHAAETISTQDEIRSRRSDIHTGPIAAHPLAEDEARRRQPSSESTGPLAGGTSKARPQEASDAGAPPSPDPVKDLGFPQIGRAHV